MRTHVGRGAGSQIERIFNARKTVRACSPWITPGMCESLVDLADREVEVWIITSNDSLNVDTLQALHDAGIPKKSLLRRILGMEKKPPANLHALIIRERRGLLGDRFLHAKIYTCDGEFAAVGSSNLTHRGMHDNIEYMITFELPDEVRQVEADFDRLWHLYNGYGSSVIEKGDLHPSSCRRR